MTDRELLKMAAKAVGIQIAEWSEIEEGYRREDGGYFRPLIDSADALRLAVELGLLIDCDNVFKEVEAVLVMRDHDDQYVRMRERYGNDPYAAARRAIVRAAAEIGRTMT